MDDRCDYCGLPNPLVMLGKRQVNIPCTHDAKKNLTEETKDRRGARRRLRTTT